MILAIFVAFFIVAGAIAVPQLILKECKNLNIRKSIIARVIMSFGFLIAFIVVFSLVESKDQNIKFFDYLLNFFKTYSNRLNDFTWINIWHGMIDMNLYNNVVWISIIMFFPQLTLLIPQFLFNQYKKYAETVEETVTKRVAVSVDGYGNVSAREANVYGSFRPYLYKTVIALIGSVAIFIPILYGIIKYLSPIYAMLIIFGIDIIILVLCLVIGRKK